MKKVILIAVIALVALATAQAQVISDEDFSGSTMVIDSTSVENDMKLLIAHDRLYGKNGLINVLIKQASKEKAETGNDGKTYNAVVINELYWTTENLEETQYRNGDYIQGYDGGVYTPIDNTTWSGLTTGAVCLYNDDLNNQCK